MSITSEGLLAVALAAVYILDSAHFLRIGEAVICTYSGSLRRVTFGWPFEFGGRRPYVPNPLTPFRAEFRVEWDTCGSAISAARQVAAEMSRHLQTLRPIGWLATACTGLIVFMAPLALALGQARLFLASTLLCFALTAVACVLVAIRRKDLGLTMWQACSVTAVALVCLPCSGNLARAVSIHRRWTLAASDLPALGFEGIKITTIRLSVRDALANALRFLPEHSKGYAVASEQLQILETESHEQL
jgi:hypothetical protein